MNPDRTQVGFSAKESADIRQIEIHFKGMKEPNQSRDSYDIALQLLVP